MKKLFFLMAFAAIFATSCHDGDIYEEYYGPNPHSEIFDAPWRDWDFNGDEYEIGFRMNAITTSVCNEGAVDAYVVFEDGLQAQLPYVRHYILDDEYTWTVTVSYAFERGNIYFYATYSDFIYDPGNEYQTYEPGNWTFRVVTTEPYY